MLSILIVTFLVVYLALAYLAYSMTRKMLKYYLQVYPHLQNLSQEWNGFIRQDKHQWDRKQILIGCFFRFPFKFLLFIQYIMVCFFIILITLPFGSQICNKFLIFYGRFYGSYIYKVLWRITEPEGTNKKIIKTPIVISNHVCWIDTMYLIVTFYPISFLSKAEVAKIPVIGRITTNAQSIYIQRNDQQARNKIIEDIKQRVSKFLQYAQLNIYQKVYPLIIFPQGTTSNGKSLLKFKLGAFNDLSPLTLIALKYTCDNFDVGMVQITQLEHLIMSFVLKVVQIEPLQGQKPQEYCVRVQQKLSSMTGFKIHKSGFRERQQHKKLIEQTIESNEKQKNN